MGCLFTKPKPLNSLDEKGGHHNSAAEELKSRLFAPRHINVNILDYEKIQRQENCIYVLELPKNSQERQIQQKILTKRIQRLMEAPPTV